MIRSNGSITSTHITLHELHLSKLLSFVYVRHQFCYFFKTTSLISILKLSHLFFCHVMKAKNVYDCSPPFHTWLHSCFWIRQHKTCHLFSGMRQSALDFNFTSYFFERFFEKLRSNLDRNEFLIMLIITSYMENLTFALIIFRFDSQINILIRINSKDKVVKLVFMQFQYIIIFISLLGGPSACWSIEPSDSDVRQQWFPLGFIGENKWGGFWVLWRDLGASGFRVRL